MKVTRLDLPEVVRLEPRVFTDDRGYFFESFRMEHLTAAGLVSRFVQDNVSRSRNGVLRGLHFQHPHGQAKLVSVLCGEVYDVAVDVRVGSPTFGRWTSEVLSEENKRLLFVPAGFAHGFLVTSAEAVVAYKCSAYYHPESERSIRWDDPRLGIDWPLGDVVLASKDRTAPLLSEIERELLPLYSENSR